VHRHAGVKRTHALTIRQQRLGARHQETIESLLTLSTLATEQFRMDEARAHLDVALDAMIAAERSHLGPQSRIRALIVALSRHHDTSPPSAIAAE
jgi:hypothetical protein